MHMDSARLTRVILPANPLCIADCMVVALIAVANKILKKVAFGVTCLGNTST